VTTATPEPRRAPYRVRHERRTIFLGKQRTKVYLFATEAEAMNQAEALSRKPGAIVVEQDMGDRYTPLGTFTGGLWVDRRWDL
jgi:hypothetical protein